MDLSQQLAQVQGQLAQLQRVQQMLITPAPAPAAPATQQLSAAPTVTESKPTGQEALLLKLYDEFVNTDEGKQLAANLAKFARFAQSKVAKQEP